MEQETTAIEHDGRHASLLGSFGDILAHLNSGIDICTRLFCTQRRSGGHSAAVRVVDYLSVDVTAGAVHRQTSPVTSALAQRSTDAAAATFKKRKLCHLTSSSLPCGR